MKQFVDYIKNKDQSRGEGVHMDWLVLISYDDGIITIIREISA